MKYQRNFNMLQVGDAATISLVILSIGLSIAIAKTDSLRFIGDNKQLMLQKEAVKVSAGITNIKSSIEEVGEMRKPKKRKEEISKIKQELENMQLEINELLTKE